MPLWIQVLVDAAGLVMVTLALLLAAGGRQGAHSGRVKLAAKPYTGHHLRRVPAVQEPSPEAAPTVETLESVLEGLKAL